MRNVCLLFGTGAIELNATHACNKLELLCPFCEEDEEHCVSGKNYVKLETLTLKILLLPVGFYVGA